MGTKMQNSTIAPELNIRGSIRTDATARELSDHNANYFPRQSMTDGGKDYDGAEYSQVMPRNGSASRVLRDMNRPGSRFYVINLDMIARTFGVRNFAGSASFAVPVATPWKPEPDANPFPGTLDIRTVARMALTFSKFLRTHGVTLRVSGNAAGTSYRCEPCAMFATREDAERFAIESGRGWGYNPDGSTFGTVPDAEDE
jgi:hypothetical protein